MGYTRAAGWGRCPRCPDTGPDPVELAAATADAWSRLCAAGMDATAAPVLYTDPRGRLHTSPACTAAARQLTPVRLGEAPAGGRPQSGCMYCGTHTLLQAFTDLVMDLAHRLHTVQDAEAAARRVLPSRTGDAPWVTLTRAWARTHRDRPVPSTEAHPQATALTAAAADLAARLAGRCEAARARATRRARRGRDRHLVWVPVATLASAMLGRSAHLVLLAGEEVCYDEAHRAMVLAVPSRSLARAGDLADHLVVLGPAAPGDGGQEWALTLAALLADDVDPVEAVTAARAVAA